MTLKTITYDDALVKPVPINDTKALRGAFWEVQFMKESFSVSYEEMLKQVPDDLPGVVEHSGGAYAQVDANDDCCWADILPDRSVKIGQLLYTHPAPDTAALQARIVELEGKLSEANAREANDYSELLDERNQLKIQNVRAINRIAELEAELLGWNKQVAHVTHQVLTCGVAASHPNANLSRTGAYLGKWNSQQAEEVRQLRDRCDKAEAQLAAQSGQEPILYTAVPIRKIPADWPQLDPTNAAFAAIGWNECRDAIRKVQTPTPAPAPASLSQPSSEDMEAAARKLIAEVFVQAALEAACTVVWEAEHEDRKKVLDDIRALYKQAIIDGVGK